MRISAVITAAGRSERMRQGGKKELLAVNGQPLLKTVLQTFLRCELFENIVITYPAGMRESCMESAGFLAAAANWVEGGCSRRASVRNGLESLEKSAPDIVLIHDAARPAVTKELIVAVCAATCEHGAAVPALPSGDAIKTVDGNGRITAHPNRISCVAVQTPQGFRYAELLERHRKIAASIDEISEEAYADDAAVWGADGESVAAVDGDRSNIKLTYPEDFDRLVRILDQRRIR